jgi:hypothetical protein
MLSNDSGNRHQRLPWLLLQSNETFISATHFDLRHPGVFLCHLPGLGLRPGKPQCANACGFFNGVAPTMETTPARR